MRFSIFFLAAILALLQNAKAVDIRGFTGYGCSHQQWICHNIPAGACCRFPVNIHSMRWSLPYYTRGLAYNGKFCTGVWPAVFGPRYNSCWDYFKQPIRSSKWQQGHCVWPRKRSILESRQDTCEKSNEGCIDPNTLVYTDPKSEETRVIDVPPGQAGEFAELVQNQQWEKLGYYENLGKSRVDTDPSVSNYTLVDDGTMVD